MNTLDDLTEQEQRSIAADYAERVLSLFEVDYPDDDRPRKAIEATRAVARGEITNSELDAAKDAAGDAAKSAAETFARDAARAASMDYAKAASRTPAGDAARAGGWAAAAAASGDAERVWQQQRINEVIAART